MKLTRSNLYQIKNISTPHLGHMTVGQVLMVDLPQETPLVVLVHGLSLNLRSHLDPRLPFLNNKNYILHHNNVLQYIIRTVVCFVFFCSFAYPYKDM